MAEIRRYKDMMEQATANMISKQDKITDFNVGSIIHTFLDTVIKICERIYVAIRQGYNDNLRLVPYSVFEFERKKGSVANGTVQFERENPLPARTQIAINTKTSWNDKSYSTTEVGYIEPGALYSNKVRVKAAGIGKDYNIPPFMIENIDSLVPSDVVKVTNHDAITGGADEESDDEFFERFKDFYNGLSGTNCYAIIDAARKVEGVRSASFKNHKPPLKKIYNASVYVDDGSGTATPELLEAVRLEIEGDGTKQHEGHLAPGVNLRILPPQAVPVYYTVIAYVYRADTGEAAAEIARILADYTNSLTIGKSVVRAQITSRILKLSYIRDLVISMPAANIDFGADQIARYGDAQVDIRLVTNG